MDKRALYQEFLKSRLQGACLYVDPSGSPCGEPAIASHSLQRKGPLEYISENGHVCGFEPVLEDGLPLPGIGRFEKIGVRRFASVFGGYCGKHDADLFKIAERDIFDLDDKIVAVLLYRSICREFVGICALLKYGPKVGLNCTGAHSYFEQLKINKALYERHLSGEVVGNFGAICCYLSDPLPFCGISCFSPKNDLRGKQLYAPDGYFLPLVGFVCGNVGGQNIVLLGGFSDTFCARNAFINSFLCVDRSRIGDLALRFRTELL